MFTVLGILVLPLLIVAGFRFKWSLLAFTISIPFRSAVVIYMFGHAFILPEVTLIILGGSFLRLLVKRRTTIPLPGTSISLLGFGLIVIVSMITLLIDPPVGLAGRPYNISQGPAKFPLSPIQFSLDVITQTILRWFFVGAVILLIAVYCIDQELIDWTVKIIVTSGLITGAVGLLYQFAILMGWTVFPATLQWLGFRRFVTPGLWVGPVPRMFSITGEPGTTAHFLLFGLAITATSMFTKSEGIFNQRLSVILSVVQFSLILLTTGTTGLGGLLVLAGFIGITGLVSDDISIKSVAGGGMIVVTVIAISILLVTIFTKFDVFTLLSYQLRKITFSAYSGSLRAQYMAHSLSLVAHRPLVGAGVGTHNGTSFFASMLAESGIFAGLLLIFAFVFSYRAGLLASKATSESSPLSLAIAVATIGTTAFVARSPLAALFPWVWVSLALPVASAYHTSSIKPKIEIICGSKPSQRE